MSRRNNPERLGAPQPDAPAPPPQVTNTKTDIFSFINPTEFIDLPSKGALYQEGHPAHGLDSIEIRHMTAKEEDILTSESLIKKGVALDRVIDSLIVNKKIKASDLLIGDKNALLLAARITGFGPEYKISVTCPACADQAEQSIDLSQIENKDTLSELEGVTRLENGNYQLVFPQFENLEIELKLLYGKDEKAISDKREKRRKLKQDAALITDQLKTLIVRVNEHVEKASLDQFVDRCPSIITRKVRKTYESLSPDIDLSYDYQCAECSFEQKASLPLTAEFFWPRQ